MNRIARQCLLASWALALIGCGGGAQVVPNMPSADLARSTDTTQMAPDFERDYRLSIGDKLYIRVGGQQAYSGAVPVGDDGIISHPQIGRLQTLGLSIADLERVISERLKDADGAATGVTVSILNLRAIYIIGEVEESGEYPYFEGLRVKEAIESAGGYTYRADEERVFVTRYSRSGEAEMPISSIALPGDIIRVPQLYF